MAVLDALNVCSDQTLSLLSERLSPVGYRRRLFYYSIVNAVVEVTYPGRTPDS